MLAQVVPVRRFGVKSGCFTYLVPPELAQKIRGGELVVVPFRHSLVPGVVWRLGDILNGSGKKLKSIEKILGARPLISPAQRRFINWLAETHRTSLGLILKMHLPPLTNRWQKLVSNVVSRHQAETVAPLQTLASRLVWYTTIVELRAALRQYEKINLSMLFLVPEIFDIGFISALVHPAFKKKLVFVHSKITNRELEAITLRLLRGESLIILGTRRALFLPWQKLAYVLLINDSNPSHKNWDQAPRFNAAEAALELARAHQAEFIVITHTPRLDLYAKVAAGLAKRSRSVLIGKKLFLIDTKEERQRGNRAVLSIQLREDLAKAAGDVFLFINRRGESAQVACRDCEFIFSCSNCRRPLKKTSDSLFCFYCQERAVLPTICPGCAGVSIVYHGLGSEGVEKIVRALYSSNYAIERVAERIVSQRSSGSENLPRLTIGTRGAWPRVRWDKLAIFAALEPDAIFFQSDYNAPELLLSLLRDAAVRLPRGSHYYLETKFPEEPIWSGLTNPVPFLNAELESRQLAQLPPFATVVKFWTSGQSVAVVPVSMREVFQTLTALTNRWPGIIIIPPQPTSPPRRSGKFWFTLIMQIPNELAPKIWLEISAIIPSDWKVDVNPLSLLSP